MRVYTSVRTRHAQVRLLRALSSVQVHPRLKASYPIVVIVVVAALWTELWPA